MVTHARSTALTGFFGLALGFALSNIGFSRWSEVHAMFTFADLRLIYTFAGGVALAGVGLALLRKWRPPTVRRVHKGTLPGAILFGTGWAVCGACPSIVLVQVGEGQLAALLTVLGVVAGTLTYKHVLAPRLKIDTGSCER
jgi:uncharacterized membrane protein YedE/YeeE